MKDKLLSKKMVQYKSFQSLPDNLKLLFRPVAMTTPEFRLIAEVFLYSVGFTQVKSFSKECNFYQLVSSRPSLCLARLSRPTRCVQSSSPPSTTTTTA